MPKAKRRRGPGLEAVLGDEICRAQAAIASANANISAGSNDTASQAPNKVVVSNSASGSMASSEVGDVVEGAITEPLQPPQSGKQVKVPAARKRIKKMSQE